MSPSIMRGITWLLSRCKKAVGKVTLQMCRGTLTDFDYGHVYAGAGIPLDVDGINVDDDIPPYTSATSIPDDPVDPNIIGTDPCSYAHMLMDQWTHGFAPSTSQPGPSTYQLPPRSTRGTRTKLRYTPSPIVPRTCHH